MASDRERRSSAELGSHLRAVRRAPGVTPTARLVYAELLVEYPDGCWLSKPRLARVLGVSERTLDRALMELVRVGLAEVVEAEEERRTNTYRALPPMPGLVEPWRLTGRNESYREGRSVEKRTKAVLNSLQGEERSVVLTALKRQCEWLKDTGSTAAWVKFQEGCLKRLCAEVVERSYCKELRLTDHAEWLMSVAESDILLIEEETTVVVREGRCLTIVPVIPSGSRTEVVPAIDWFALSFSVDENLAELGVTPRGDVFTSQSMRLSLLPGLALNVRDLYCKIYDYGGVLRATLPVVAS